jgi:hypothetical protein
MVKKIYSFLLMLTVFVACKDDQVGIITYTRKIDLTKSTLSANNLNAAYLYSVDGGAKWVAFPSLKNGQTYQAKVVYNPDPDHFTFPDEGSIEIIPACPFAIDWSASDPAPKSVDDATGIATFTVGGKNSVVATVTNIPLDLDATVGTYAVVDDEWADFAVGNHLTVQKVDATHLRILEYPATDTNHAPLVITVTPATGAATVKSQNNGYYSVYGAGTDVTSSGTGSVYSCNGTVDLTIDFIVKGFGDQGKFHLALQKL